MNELPKGWVWAKLQEVAILIMGQSPPSNSYNTSQEGLPFFQGKAEFGSLYPTVKKYCSSPIKIAQAGDVLISVRAPVGPTNLSVEESCIGRGLAAIRPLGEVPNRFLLYYLRNIEEWLSAQGTGSTFTAISKSDLEQIELPIPPLNEQRRIVAKLEMLLSRVDAAQARLTTIPHTLKCFRQSVLAAACVGQLTADWRAAKGQQESADTLFKEIQALRRGDKKRQKLPAKTEGLEDFGEQLNDVPDTWKWVTLDSLCDPSRGISYGVIKLGPEVEGGVPCLRTSDVRRLRIDVEHVKRISADISADYGRTVLMGNEILVSVRGTLGGVAVVPTSLRGWNISREVALVPCVPIVDRKFVAFWIASNRSQNWLSGVEKGVAYTGINLEDLRLLPTALPPAAEQQEIVRRVEALFKTADALEARYNKAKANFDKLPQSILARAFRGELVPQDPNDEPVSILLERIRTELARKEKAPRKTRRTGSLKPKRSEVIMLRPEETKHSHLSDILKDRGPLSPEALWKESQLDIDAFYAQLKLEETRGLLKEKSNDASKASRLLEAA